jgi:hypothetical protein
MKKAFILILVIVILSGISGYLLWLKNKNRIVKDLIVNSVSTLTDSLYSLRYDSSMVDELNGEAYFENVNLKSDSLQLARLILSHNLPNIILEINIKSITAKGLNIPLAINEKKLVANKIILNEPIITIINTGEYVFKKEDTIALFRKILGNYNSIRAENIDVINANIIHKNLNGTVNTKLTKLNISFTNITVDSTKDYNNVICYFINNMKANLEEVFINQSNKDGTIVMNNLRYDAREQHVLIEKISTISEGKNEEQFLLTSVKLEELNIHDFIEEHTISVGNVSTKECMLTLFINKKVVGKSDLNKVKNFDFPDDYFDKIKIGGITIGKSVLIFRSRSEPSKPPIRINGFTFQLSKNMKISERSTLRSILDSAKWNMQADDFAFKSKDNNYTISFNGLKVDKATSTASIRSLKVKPVQSEEAMTSKLTYQQDIYNIEMNEIKLLGVDINKFINESSLQIQEVVMNLALKVYHDRSLKESPVSKVGKYPHQLLLHIDLPLNIQKAFLKNSMASYKERSKETQEIGHIFFTNIEGEVKNITNIPLFIQPNSICKLIGSGLLLGKAKCTTEWRLFLDSKNGQFELEGQVGSIDFKKFNPMTKPLGLTTLEGQLHSIKFSMTGNDNGATGELSMLYSHLKLETFDFNLANHQFAIKKTKSALSNLFIKKNNPSNGNTRLAKFSVERNIQKSFFNLVWKGVYDGVQNTILNRKIAAIKKQIQENK